MSHPLGQVFCPLVYFPLPNLGHIFRPESVGQVLGAMILSWREKFWHCSPPVSDIFPHYCPPLRNLCIAFALSMWGICWVLWFCLGKINLGMAQPMYHIFSSLVSLLLHIWE